MSLSSSSMPTWLSAPATAHDAHKLNFDLDTSLSIYSDLKHPIIRINPTPGPRNMSLYDDPAFSSDPRSNPHFVTRDTLPPYSAVEKLEEHVESKHLPPRTTPPFASSEDPASFASLFTRTKSSTSETTPSPVTPDRPPRQRRRSARPSTDLDKIEELDEVDKMDISDPFGTRHHHYGPYQTANEALTARKPSVNRNAPPLKQPPPVQRISHAPPMPIGASISLIPGQILPRMPFRPEPPADYVSPAPTFGPLYPDSYPYDMPNLPHPPQPFNYTSMPDPRLSITRPPAFPIPRNPNPDSNYASPPPLRSQRHSLPAQPRPPPEVIPHPHSAPNVYRIPSDPVRPRENAPPPRAEPPPLSRRSLSSSAPFSNAPSSSTPSSSAPPSTTPSSGTSSSRAPSSRAPSSRPPSSHAPSSRVPSSRASSSGSSSYRTSMSTKSVYAPRHVPKKLVMPAPLQPQQQQQVEQPHLSHTYPIDDYTLRSSPNRPQPLQEQQQKRRTIMAPKAQDIPMIQDDKGARHLLRKKTAPAAVAQSKSFDDNAMRDRDKKSTPVKEKMGGLFRGRTTSGSVSKIGRKLSKKK